MESFNALVLSLPTRNSTLRMRLWRALKETGCGVLRDGVYVLPAAADASGLAKLEADVRSQGGFAMTAALTPRTAAQLMDIRKLFDRSAGYGDLVERIATTKAALERLGARRGQTAIRRLERAWATRKTPWVDRLASAWLIKRFIDRDARFAWIARPSECPKNAVGFDFDGAEFTHVKNRVTFEVLVASFGLDKDPALAAVGAAVHFLDVGGIPVPDAKGLETMLKGAREKARSDDALLGEAMRILDLLYSGATATRS